MDTFDYYNAHRTQSSTPEDLVDRKKELIEMYKAGNIKDVEFPMISPTMWDEYEREVNSP